MDNRLTNIEIRVSGNESSIIDLFEADVILQQLIDANQNSINSLTLSINSNDIDISNSEQDVAFINQTINSLRNELADKQDRVTGICPAGSSIREVNYQGGVICETDSVSAGVGTLIASRVSFEAELAPVDGLYVGRNGDKSILSFRYQNHWWWACTCAVICWG